MVILTNNTGLFDDATEIAYMAARASDVELDAHEELLAIEMLQDIDHKPMLGILKRRGEYSFAVAYGCAIPSLKQYAQHVRTSNVKLDKNETFCTAGRLERVGRMVCERLRVKFPEIQFVGTRAWQSDKCGTFYTYTVSY